MCWFNFTYLTLVVICLPEKDGSEELETEGAREETMERNN
jgi:hypothetical protein